MNTELLSLTCMSSPGRRVWEFTGNIHIYESSYRIECRVGPDMRSRWFHTDIIGEQFGLHCSRSLSRKDAHAWLKHGIKRLHPTSPGCAVERARHGT